MSRIVVVGSINMDLVNHVDDFPLPGETIHGHGVEYLPGGKGANQAVAAARAGGDVRMIGAVGGDVFGRELLASLSGAGVRTDTVAVKEGTSGLAFITVSRTGENQIILSAGSNGKLTAEDVPPERLAEAEWVLLQNEIPQAVNRFVLEKVRHTGAKVIYNPAPARPIEPDLYPLIDVIAVNETEAESLTGVNVRGKEDAALAAAEFARRGVRSVVVTLGAKGACYFGPEGETWFAPAFSVTPVDTTAAGDTFLGAFAAACADGMETAAALRFASAAAAIAVSRKGAQASIPVRDEILGLLASDKGAGENPPSK